jgi:hypothetical protein
MAFIVAGAAETERGAKAKNAAPAKSAEYRDGKTWLRVVMCSSKDAVFFSAA